MSMLHVHVSMLHVYCCFSMMLIHVHASCPSCMHVLHVCVSTLHVHAAGTCCLNMNMYMQMNFLVEKCF
jgi:hypothetical protein